MTSIQARLATITSPNSIHNKFAVKLRHKWCIAQLIILVHKCIIHIKCSSQAGVRIALEWCDPRTTVQMVYHNIINIKTNITRTVTGTFPCTMLIRTSLRTLWTAIFLRLWWCPHSQHNKEPQDRSLRWATTEVPTVTWMCSGINAQWCINKQHNTGKHITVSQIKKCRYNSILLISTTWMRIV